MAPLSIYLTQVPMVHIHSVIISSPVTLAAPKSPFFSWQYLEVIIYS